MQPTIGYASPKLTTHREVRECCAQRIQRPGEPTHRMCAIASIESQLTQVSNDECQHNDHRRGPTAWNGRLYQALNHPKDVRFELPSITGKAGLVTPLNQLPTHAIESRLPCTLADQLNIISYFSGLLYEPAHLPFCLGLRCACDPKIPVQYDEEPT